MNLDFEIVLKAVIIENYQVDWKYECEESKSNWSVKITKLAQEFHREKEVWMDIEYWSRIYCQK